MISTARLRSFPAVRFALAAAALSETSHAATSSGGDAHKLETVVVVGQATARVLDAEALTRVQAVDLEDVFRSEPSVNVGGGAVGIAQKIYLRGMEDTLLNITVDGAPQTGTLFHHIGRVSVEPELLEQVEVQAGAGEATSGAGAIGGAIRFKTKEASDLLEDGEDFGGIVKGHYFSNDGNKGSGTLFGRLGENWGALASVVRVDQNLREDGDGHVLLGTAAEQLLGFAKVDGSLTESQWLTLSYEQREEEGKFGSKPNWSLRTADEILYPVEAKRRTAVLNYGWNFSERWSVEVAAYQTVSEFEQDRFDRWGRYGAEMETKGFDLRNTSLLGDHQVVYGEDYRKDRVSSRYLETDTPGWNFAWDPTVVQFAEVGYVRGAYLQDHYRVLEPVLLSFGARYDSYDFEQLTYTGSAASDEMSLNAGIEYSPVTELTVSLGYAQAMRGKEVGDAFTLEHRPGRLSVAPSLKAEEVVNTELGVNYDNGQWRGKLAFYRTEIDKVILDQIGTVQPQDAVYYENIGTLEIPGLEVAGGFSLARVDLDLAYSRAKPELNGDALEAYEHNGLGSAAGPKWVLKLHYNLSDRLKIGWLTTVVEDLNPIEVLQRNRALGWVDELESVDKPGYSVHDLYVDWLLLADDQLRLTLAVQNLLDETYRSHSSVADYSHIPDYEGIVGVNEPGRDIRLGLGYRF